MPPRLQRLNAARLLRQQDALSEAAFSTTARALSAEPSSSATSLLASMESRHVQTQAPSWSIHKHEPQVNASANDHLLNLIGKAKNRAMSRQTAEVSRVSVTEELKNSKNATELTRQISRRWKAGDVYAPHDLSSTEMRKWKKRGKPEQDVFDLLDFHPVEEYKNFAIMSEYMTPMGRILSSAETGLRGVNQRRIARAIRRSIGLGLMPSVHRHPEVLYKTDMKLRRQINGMRVL